MVDYWETVESVIDICIFNNFTVLDKPNFFIISFSVVQSG